MQISMYRASVPPFIRTLKALSGVLDKAAAHAEARKIDPAVLLSSRLYPDMYPLLRQVQMTSDNAKGAGARLAGVEVPSYADTETTIPELKQRLQKTVDFLDTLKPEQFEGAETRPIKLVFPSLTLEFNGLDYLLDFAQPNVYFHMTTAYAILRHNGLEIGKTDFLGMR